MFPLAMMPMVGDLMVQQNLSLPGTYNNLDDFVTELLIRSCGASWTQLVDDMGAIELEEQFLTTDVHVVVPTSRANVPWRGVLLWLLLNLMFTLSGLLFLVIQRACNHSNGKTWDFGIRVCPMRQPLGLNTSFVTCRGH